MALRAALKGIKAPNVATDIISSGAISGLVLDEDGVARFTLDIGDIGQKAGSQLLTEAEAAAQSVDGVTRVSAIATTHRAAAPPKPRPAPAPPRATRHANPMGLGKQQEGRDGLKDVKHIIAIASGKGGVGKSTIAANLALALQRDGAKVGILDADIYGPSLPTLLSLKDKPDISDGLIQPMDVQGLKAMSIGLVVAADKALAWRGPMVMGAVRQLMNDVNWGALDVLIIDTPPGTGDAHLTLAQSGKLTGAVIVSTPQEMALADVRRGVELFRKVKTPVFGLIENMAYLEMPDGSLNYIFGKDGARNAANSLDTAFLGSLPILPDLRQASDDGEPLKSGTPTASAFDALAVKIRDAIIAQQSH